VFSPPAPVVEEPTTGISVTKDIEFGVMRIITGWPFLSLAVMMKEPGTMFTSLNPADLSLCRSDCGRF